MGGSKGPLAFPGGTPLLKAVVLPVAPGLKALVVPDVATNPTKLTVSLAALSSAKAAIGKSWILQTEPASLLVGPSPRSIAVPYAVVEDYDVALAGIDVTQGIQPEQPLPPGRTAPYQGLTLVEDKTPVARVFAVVAAPAATTVGPATILLRGWRFRNGFTQEKESLGPPLIRVGASLPPGDPDQVSIQTLTKGEPAAVFTLPPSWTEAGPITLHAEVLPPKLYAPAQAAECSALACAVNNSYRLTNIPFRDTGYVSVWPIWGRVRGGVFPSLALDQPFPGLPQSFLAPANQLLPLADGELRGATWAETFDATSTLSAAIKLESLPGPFHCSESCNLSGYLKTGSSRRDIEMVMTDDMFMSAPFGVFGVNDHAFGPTAVFQWAAHSVVNLRRPLTSIAHESGHALGREHADTHCKGDEGDQEADEFWPDGWGTIGGIGYDVRGGTVLFSGSSPFTPDSADDAPKGSWFDFMSYCADARRSVDLPSQPWPRRDGWISPRNWNKYLGFLKTIVDARGSAVLASYRAQADATATLSVRAQVETGNVVVTQIRPGDGPARPRRESPYHVLLRDRSGGVLADWPIASSPVGDGGAAFLSADVPLPPFEAGELPAVLASVEIVRAGHTLARVLRSASRPTAQLRLAGSKLPARGAMAVRWFAGDADRDARLTIAIDYSEDDGRSWSQIYVGPNSGRVSLPASHFSASRKARLRLRVGDGFDETRVVSNRLFAPGRAPDVEISSPGRGARLSSDAQIYLSATAYDDEGTFLDGKRVVWFDGTRRLAAGRLASARGLSPGVHVLRAVATDRRGRTGDASVRVRIVPATPGILVTRGPNRLSRAAGVLRLRVACTVPAVLSTAGPSSRDRAFREGCGTKARAVQIPVRPGRGDLRLDLRAQAPGAPAAVLTIVIRR